MPSQRSVSGNLLAHITAIINNSHNRERPNVPNIFNKDKL